jgi:hypothetical protein
VVLLQVLLLQHHIQQLKYSLVLKHGHHLLAYHQLIMLLLAVVAVAVRGQMRLVLTVAVAVQVVTK